MKLAESDNIAVSKPTFYRNATAWLRHNWRTALVIAVVSAAIGFSAGFKLSTKVSEREITSAIASNDLVEQREAAAGRLAFAEIRRARGYDNFVRDFQRRIDGETIMDRVAGFFTSGKMDQTTSRDGHYMVREIARHRLEAIPPITAQSINQLEAQGAQRALASWRDSYRDTAEAYSKALFRTVNPDELIPELFAQQAIRTEIDKTQSNGINGKSGESK